MNIKLLLLLLLLLLVVVVVVVVIIIIRSRKNTQLSLSLLLLNSDDGNNQIKKWEPPNNELLPWNNPETWAEKSSSWKWKKFGEDSYKATLTQLKTSTTGLIERAWNLKYLDDLRNNLKIINTLGFDRSLKDARKKFFASVLLDMDHEVKNELKRTAVSMSTVLTTSADEIFHDLLKDKMSDEVKYLEKNLAKNWGFWKNVGKDTVSALGSLASKIGGIGIGMGIDILVSMAFPQPPSLSVKEFENTMNQFANLVQQEFANVNNNLQALSDKITDLSKQMSEMYKKLRLDIEKTMISGIQYRTITSQLNILSGKYNTWSADLNTLNNILNIEDIGKTDIMCLKTYRCNWDKNCDLLQKIVKNHETMFKDFTTETVTDFTITKPYKVPNKNLNLPYQEYYTLIEKAILKLKNEESGSLSEKELTASIDNDKKLSPASANTFYFVMNMFEGAGIAFPNTDPFIRAYLQSVNYQMMSMFTQMINYMIVSIKVYVKFSTLYAYDDPLNLATFIRTAIARLAYYLDCFVLTLRNSVRFTSMKKQLEPASIPSIANTQSLLLRKGDESLQLPYDANDIYVGDGWRYVLTGPDDGEKTIVKDQACCNAKYSKSFLIDSNGKKYRGCNATDTDINKCINKFDIVNPSIDGIIRGACTVKSTPDDVPAWTKAHSWINNSSHSECDRTIICPTDDSKLTCKNKYSNDVEKECNTINESGLENCYLHYDVSSYPPTSGKLLNEHGGYSWSVKSSLRDKYSTGYNDNRAYEPSKCVFGVNTGWSGGLTLGGRKTDKEGHKINNGLPLSDCKDVKSFPICVDDKDPACELQKAYAEKSYVNLKYKTQVLSQIYSEDKDDASLIELGKIKTLSEDKQEAQLGGLINKLGSAQKDKFNQKISKYVPCNDLDQFCNTYKIGDKIEPDRTDKCNMLYTRCFKGHNVDLCTDSDTSKCSATYAHLLFTHMIERTWGDKYKNAKDDDEKKNFINNMEYECYKSEVFSKSIATLKTEDDINKFNSDMMNGKYDKDLVNLLDVYETGTPSFYRKSDDVGGYIKILVETKFENGKTVPYEVKLDKDGEKIYVPIEFTDETGKACKEPYMLVDSATINNFVKKVGKFIEGYKTYFNYEDLYNTPIPKQNNQTLIDIIKKSTYNKSVCSVQNKYDINGKENPNYTYWCKACKCEENLNNTDACNKGVSYFPWKPSKIKK